jgi:hypothetical protein
MDPAIHDLARRLIALEASRAPSDGLVVAAMRAYETLRGPLAKLVGMAGFRAILSRALAMAKREAPALDAVRLRPDGSLEGLDGVGGGGDAEAGAVVMAQMLGLLIIFIGEPLTLRLVRDAWPEATGPGLDAGSGEAS